MTSCHRRLRSEPETGQSSRVPKGTVEAVQVQVEESYRVSHKSCINSHLLTTATQAREMSSWSNLSSQDKASAIHLFSQSYYHHQQQPCLTSDSAPPPLITRKPSTQFWMRFSPPCTLLQMRSQYSSNHKHYQHRFTSFQYFSSRPHLFPQSNHNNTNPSTNGNSYAAASSLAAAHPGVAASALRAAGVPKNVASTDNVSTVSKWSQNPKVAAASSKVSQLAGKWSANGHEPSTSAAPPPPPPSTSRKPGGTLPDGLASSQKFMGMFISSP